MITTRKQSQSRDSWPAPTLCSLKRLTACESPTERPNSQSRSARNCTNMSITTMTGGARNPTDNPMQRMPKGLQNYPRCHARTRKGSPCQSTAVRGKQRCPMQGGTNRGAPKGKRNGMYSHRSMTQEAVALRRAASWLIGKVRGDCKVK